MSSPLFSHSFHFSPRSLRGSRETVGISYFNSHHNIIHQYDKRKTMPLAKQHTQESGRNTAKKLVRLILPVIGVVFLFRDPKMKNELPGQLVITNSALILHEPPSTDDFALAYEESLGFFDNIHKDEWELLRNITLRRVNNVDKRIPLRNAHNPQQWYQENWDPDFSCRHDTKVGVGDGAKWVCDPHRLEAQAKRRMEQYQKEGRLVNQTTGKEIRNGCLVYSVGSEGDFRFEEGVHAQLPGVCEIHTFDFTNYAHRVPPGKNIFFHHWGLKPSYIETKQASSGGFGQAKFPGKPFKTFKETIRELGHEGRPIDIFKIDCEGCEWSTYKDWIDADFRQILVEVHRVPEVAQDFFSDLQKAGYVTYHKEPNIQYGGGQCVEYAFLKLSTKYVEDRLRAVG